MVEFVRNWRWMIASLGSIQILWIEFVGCLTGLRFSRCSVVDWSRKPPGHSHTKQLTRPVVCFFVFSVSSRVQHLRNVITCVQSLPRPNSGWGSPRLDFCFFFLGSWLVYWSVKAGAGSLRWATRQGAEVLVRLENWATRRPAAEDWWSYLGGLSWWRGLTDTSFCWSGPLPTGAGSSLLPTETFIQQRWPSVTEHLSVGRSRARKFKLLGILRIIAGRTLAFGVSLSVRWVPSEYNTSDEPSRGEETLGEQPHGMCATARAPHQVHCSSRVNCHHRSLSLVLWSQRERMPKFSRRMVNVEVHQRVVTRTAVPAPMTEIKTQGSSHGFRAFASTRERKPL